MGHAARNYWKGKFLRHSSSPPCRFGLTALEFNAWIEYGGGLKYGNETTRL